MSYESATYLVIFLPLVLLAYQLTPKKGRWIVLLLASYGFFWMISGILVLYLIGTTAFTYGIGVWISKIRSRCETVTQELKGKEKSAVKKQYKKKEKTVLIIGIVAVLAVLVSLKYYNFFAENVNGLLQYTGAGSKLPLAQLLVPIGISFYTLEAIGYMADVYWGKVDGLQNPGKLALFLSFFPQLMEGPIALYSQTADALWEGKPLQGDNLSKGYVRILWGSFKKRVIADRLNIAVGVLFTNYQNYHGVMIAVAAVAYTLQLYMEFSGCMDIIIGSGKLFGVTLPENFRQPFASKNAAEFWRRWHITLGVWFKTYIFYPVSVSSLVKKWNKFGKKHVGKYLTKLGVSALCLFPVWLCNGLWHGARWSYLFYGMYYFVILLGGIAIEPVRDKVIQKFHLDENALYYRIPQRLKTWIIIFTGELFFRADSLGAGLAMFQSLFHQFGIKQLWDGTILTLGMDLADYLAIIVGTVIAAVVGSIKERNLLGEEGLQKFALPVRWAIYYGLIFAIIIFGAYGIGYQRVDMIYAGF